MNANKRTQMDRYKRVIGKKDPQMNANKRAQMDTYKRVIGK